MIATSDPAVDRLISKQEALQRLPIGKSKLDELLMRGQIASAKVGTRRLICAASLERFIAAAIAANSAAIEK